MRRLQVDKTPEVYTVIAVSTMSKGYRLKQVYSFWGLSFATVNGALVVLKPFAFVASGSITSRAQRTVRKLNLLYVRGTARIRPWRNPHIIPSFNPVGRIP